LSRNLSNTFWRSLTEIERRPDPTCFVRDHCATLVNIEHLAELHPMFHGDSEIVLRRGTRLILSRRYRRRLQPFLLS
jgi:two-component system, LytTR family, response regulator